MYQRRNLVATRLRRYFGGARELPPAILTEFAGKAPADGEATMAWAILVIAGLFETAWAVGLKFTDGFTRPIPSILTILAMVLSMVLLGFALKSLSVGTAYAIWTGIGTTGTVLLGIYLFDEPATVARLACIGLIVAGITGLKFVG
jgi:quaternary ammonium compound-resistance protein SugE